MLKAREEQAGRKAAPETTPTGPTAGAGEREQQTKNQEERTRHSAKGAEEGGKERADVGVTAGTKGRGAGAKGGDGDKTGELEAVTSKRESEQSGRKGAGAELSDWGESGLTEAGIHLQGEATEARAREGHGDKTGQGKGKGRAPEEAPKGPRAFPHFCQLCKIYGHSYLTCYRQGNAPTPGPSKYMKPYKHTSKQTPLRGLGFPLGSGKEEGQTATAGKGGITFIPQRASQTQRPEEKEIPGVEERTEEPETSRKEGGENKVEPEE